MKDANLDIWSSILKQVRQTDTKKLAADRSFIVLGYNEVGKTTLIARLAGQDGPKKGSGLEYNSIDVRDEYRDDSTKLGAWVLDGDAHHVKLLNFALTEANFEHSCCLLVASMSQPWNIMRSLEYWATILEKHIENLNIDPKRLKRCRQKLLHRFVSYVPPSDEIDSKLISGIKTDSTSRRNSTFNSSGNSESRDDGQDFDNETTLWSEELGEKAFSRNLGIEIIVVITKTDHIPVLEKDHDYTEEHFDFIQQAIRKFCLQFGASLFYVSAKVNKNCDLLHKYLAHRMYDLPFNETVSVVDKDAIFVPAGWDNERKISILYDNLRTVDPDSDYSNFIFEAINQGGPAQRDVEVLVESEQDFLMRMQGDLGKQGGPSSLPNAPSPVQPRQNLNTSLDGQPSGEGVLQNFFNSLLSKGNV